MLKISLYVIILLFSFQISAAITSKESEVVSPLLMDVNSSLTMENISELSTSSEPSQQGVFPVICTRLHPGSVMKRQLLTGWGPVFIIGDDPFSLRWMSEHLEILKSLNALGLVVNVESVDGFAPIFPDTCYHLTHYWLAAVDIPVASDNPVHYADAIRYNARTPLQGSLLPLTRLVWA